MNGRVLNFFTPVCQLNGEINEWWNTTKISLMLHQNQNILLTLPFLNRILPLFSVSAVLLFHLFKDSGVDGSTSVAFGP